MLIVVAARIEKEEKAVSKRFSLETRAGRMQNLSYVTRALLFVASVAQLVEQLTLNQLVLGSSPSRGTTSKDFPINHLRKCVFSKKARKIAEHPPCPPPTHPTPHFFHA